MNNLKLQVGKPYRTRSGEKVKIEGYLKLVETCYPFIGIDEDGNKEFYTEDGRYNVHVMNSPYDLIAEWEDEPMPHFPKNDINTFKNGTYTISADDKVNHPAHYTGGKVECIDAIESATACLTGIEAVCTANAIKYLWRWKQKNGIEDLKKAQWYINRMLEK